MRMPPPPSVASVPFAVFPLIVEFMMLPRLVNIPPDAAPAVFPLIVTPVSVIEALAETFIPPPLPNEVFPLMVVFAM